MPFQVLWIRKRFRAGATPKRQIVQIGVLRSVIVKAILFEKTLATSWFWTLVSLFSFVRSLMYKQAILGSKSAIANLTSNNIKCWEKVQTTNQYML